MSKDVRSYKPEIDGLRAIAVLAVVFFHSGLNFPKGGFLGVDVFFVISGYLISMIIRKEIEGGGFSLKNFYERRARRILPALYLVLFVFVPLAWIYQMPGDLKEFSYSLLSTVCYYSNLFFWKKSGYFDGGMNFRPLIHTWSLAVEEQYYLFFPVFLIFVYRFFRKHLKSLILILTVASLCLSQWASVWLPKADFFLLPTRAWELFVGTLITFEITDDLLVRNFLGRQILSGLGLLMILYAVLYFDEFTPTPSIYTLVPTIGTALVILTAREDTWTGKLLSSGPLTWVGLLSYGVYLWHQPVFVFKRIWFGDDWTWMAGSLSIALVFVLAYLSLRILERPFRDKKKVPLGNFISIALAASIALCSIGIAGVLSSGMQSRLNPEQRRIDSFRSYPERDEVYRVGKCDLDVPSTYKDFAPECVPASAVGKSIMVWGDSHAAALSYGLRALDPSLIQVTASRCPPIFGAVIPGWPNGPGINEFAIRVIGKMKPQTVFLHACWTKYDISFLVPGLKEAIRRIRAVSPASRVVILGSVPQWSPDLPTLMIRRGLKLSPDVYSRSDNFKEVERYDSVLSGVAQNSHVSFVSLLNFLCGDQGCLATVTMKNEVFPIVWDDAHLTEAGSRYVAAEVLKRVAH